VNFKLGIEYAGYIIAGIHFMKNRFLVGFKTMFDAQSVDMIFAITQHPVLQIN
jgi:hypothetical protein